MTLPDLGTLFERMIEAAVREGKRFIDLFFELVANNQLGAFADWVSKSRFVASLTAWQSHSNWLEIPQTPSETTLISMGNEAKLWGDTVRARVEALLRSGQPPQPRVYVELSASVAVRSGWTQGAKTAALDSGQDLFKTWVRAYPTKQRRDWHDLLNGITIPANAKFTLPAGPNRGAKIEAPHDWGNLPDPREHINCGHAVIYVPQARLSDLGLR